MRGIEYRNPTPTQCFHLLLTFVSIFSGIKEAEVLRVVV
jgi:hypothetical protein